MVRELGDIASEVEITLLRKKADEVLSERSAWRVRRKTVGFRGLKNGDQFREASLIKIANRRIASRLDPLGMLRPQVVMDPLLKLSVRKDRTGRRYCQRLRSN
jgi:hypothetical protein